MAFVTGTVAIEDYNNERTTSQFNLQDVDDAGLLYGSIAQDLDEIKDAIAPLIVGKIRDTIASVDYPETEDEVTDVQAARESKWLVTYKDILQYLDVLNTVLNPGFGKVFTFTIGTAKRTLLTAHSDTLVIASGVGATFVAAMEPNFRSPYNRSAESAIDPNVTPINEILSVVFVGRNN